jgi:hypothetical protein
MSAFQERVFRHNQLVGFFPKFFIVEVGVIGMKTKKSVRGRKMNTRQFWDMVAEAKKDPNFKKEMNAFIKASTGIYKLPRNFFSKTS